MFGIQRSEWLAVVVLCALVAPASGWQEQEQSKGGVEDEASSSVVSKIRLELERLHLDSLSSEDIESRLPQLDQLEASCKEQMKLFKPEHSKWRILNDTLSEVLLTRIAMLMQLGRVDEAKARLREVQGSDSSSKELSRRIEKLQETLGTDPDRPDVQQRVAEALESGDLATVAELGTIAVPALESWILAHPSEFSADASADPLRLLFRLDRRGAGAFALEHYDLDGYLWKRRLARLVGQMNLFQEHQDFSSSEEVPRVCSLPEWMHVLELLVEDSELGAEVMPRVSAVMKRGGTTPRLEAALLAILSMEGARRDALFDALRQVSWYQEDMRRVLETAVTHSSASIRGLAAEKLLSYERSEALLSRWNDPEVWIRQSVAKAFQFRNLDGRNYLPPFLSQDRELLARLAQDSDSSVRLAVLDALVQHASEVEDALFEPFTRDSDPEVRKQFASKLWQNTLPNERSLRLSARLADDPDAQVVRDIDAHIDYSISSRSFEPFLPLLEARLESTRQPWRATHEAGNRQSYFATISNSDVGKDWLARRGIEWNDAELLKALSGSRTILFYLAPELTAPFLEKLFAIDPEAVERLTKKVREPDREDENAREGVARGLIEFARDPALDPRFRFLLASTDGRLAGPLVADTAISALSDPRWKPGGPWGDSLWFRKAVRDRMNDVPDAEHNRIVLEVLARSDADPVMQDAAANLIQPYAKGGATVVKAVLDRWFEDSQTNHYSVEASIGALGKLVLDGRDEVLHRAVAEGRYVDPAAIAMGESRDETFIPDLVTILTTQGDNTWVHALGSLSSFLSDSAAEALLDVSARLTNSTQRTNVLAAVESIRTYQEARERWASRRLGKQTREKATEDLAGMLEAKDALIRAEAAKGLATLGAVEALPRLIRLLQDPSEDVRKAAREALDQLNRMAAEEQALDGKQDGAGKQ